MNAEIKQSTWCVVPMFNEGPEVAKVIGQLKETFPNVLCVDDGSSDDSIAEASRAGAIVIALPINVGQGGALQTGFSFVRTISSARYVVSFDADGQHDPKDAEVLVRHLVERELDVVFATRFSGEGGSNVPWAKRHLLRTIARAANLSRQIKLSDSHNGLRAFTVETLSKVKITQNRMAHSSEIVSLVSENGLKYDEVPVTIRYTPYSMSKGQPLLNGVNILVDLLLG